MRLPGSPLKTLQPYFPAATALLLLAAISSTTEAQQIAAQQIAARQPSAMMSARNWTIHQNSDIANPGHSDVGGGPAQSAEDCAAMCVAHQNCASASWNGPSSHYHDNNCNLHCGGRLVPNHGETAIIVRDVGRGEQLCSQAPPPPPAVQLPVKWLQRHSAGNLVWAITPATGAVPGPLPNFGNGYIAAQFAQAGGAMYIAGVMNGALPPPFGPEKGNGVSQRAGVPLLLGRISSTGWRQEALANDLELASVEELYADSEGAKATLQHYAHRANMHLLVTDISIVNANSGTNSSVMSVRYHWSVPDTAAVTFAQTSSAPPGATCQLGRTAVAETGARRVTIAICYNRDEVKVSTDAKNATVVRDSLLTAIYTSLDSADPLADAMAAWKAHCGSATTLMTSHTAAQEALWNSRIEIGGNLDLALSVNSSMYGIMISVRDELNFSTSPGGLPNGCYNGHTFWDVEQFIWPNLLLLHPKMAKAAMQYRYDRMDAARNNSVALTNTAGLKYPWESAFTGLAACPFFAQQNEVREIHIDGDVSLAMWQVWQVTHDLEWLEHVGWPVISGIADFWASRLSPGPNGNMSNISLVDAGGPDESNSHALDNTYDLASALHSLQHAVAAAKLLAKTGKTPVIGGNWSTLIDVIPSSITYGSSEDGRTIIRCWAEGKDQCNGIGVIMLRYPLNISRQVLDDDVAAADLDFYATQWPTGNAMYWSMFTIGYADLGSHSAADHYLTKSTQSNLYGPFRIWSENMGGGGCPNFLTGAGVYLQSIWAGYSGIRWGDDELQIVAPRLLPNTTQLVVRGLYYLGSRLLVDVRTTDASVSILSQGATTLRIAVEGTDEADLTTKPVLIGSRASIFAGA